MTTFLYILSDPNTGKARYLGKSDNPFKRFRDHCRKFKLQNTAASKWIGSLAAKGQRPLMDILDEVPFSEWPFWEKEYIRVFRAINIPLLNLADGGEGGDLPPESRERGAAKLRGRKLTPEHIKAATAHHLGRVRSEKTRQAISKALTGRIFSKKHRENMGLAHRGIPLSESHKNRLSKASLGKPKTEAHRLAIGNGHRGKKFTVAHCEELSRVRKGKPWTLAQRAAYNKRRGT